MLNDKIFELICSERILLNDNIIPIISAFDIVNNIVVTIKNNCHIYIK